MPKQEKRYRFDDKCPKCTSVNIDGKEVPGSAMWAYNYRCKDCGLLFSINIEDRMGSQQGDTITLNHQFDPMEEPKKEIAPETSVSVDGVVVMVLLDDGSLRQAHISSTEHMRTILNICTMNEKKGLKLGSQDFSELLAEHLWPADAEKDGSGDS